MLEPRTYFKILVGSKFLISNLLLIEKQCSVVCKKTKSMCHLKDARAVESMGGALHVGGSSSRHPVTVCMMTRDKNRTTQMLGQRQFILNVIFVYT